MKIFLTVLSLFILASSLDAYSKKIVIGSFSSKKNAKKLLRKLPKVIPQYKELKELLKAEGSTIHVRKVGEYYLVVAEMFTDKKVANKSLKIIKFFFKNAYMNDAPSEKDLLEKAKAIAKLKEELALLKKQKLQREIKSVLVEAQVVKPAVKKVQPVVQKVQEKKEETFTQKLKFMDFTFLVLFILIMAMIYYIIDLREKKQLRDKE
mgnify:CR=1 FL=1